MAGVFVLDVLRLLKPINRNMPYSYSGQSEHIIGTVV